MHKHSGPFRSVKLKNPTLQGIYAFLLFLSISSCTSINDTQTDPSLTPLSVFEDAFTNKKSNIQVKQVGTINAILPDDTSGSRHQRMIVKLTNNQTLLISHNIDIAQRVPNPTTGKDLKFYGEYEWNSQGGVIHWTHKDPNHVHVDGWLEYEGKRWE